MASCGWSFASSPDLDEGLSPEAFRGTVVLVTSLLRPSVLAKAWGVHPRTVTAWIRSGRLAGVKTPGDHHRVRIDDVIAYCEAEGLPLPKVATVRDLSVLVAKRQNLDVRPLRRALRALDVEILVTTSAAGALLAVAADPPGALVLDAQLPGLDVIAAIRALGEAKATARLPVLVCDAAKAKIPSYLTAGAVAVAARGEIAALADELTQLARP